MAAFNAEAKFQADALKDIYGKNSLYNRYDPYTSEQASDTRIPLKKLIDNQRLLVKPKTLEINDKLDE